MSPQVPATQYMQKTKKMLRTKSMFLPESPKYSAAIAVAFREDMKIRHVAAKTFMRSTGAGERTVNN